MTISLTTNQEHVVSLQRNGTLPQIPVSNVATLKHHLSSRQVSINHTLLVLVMVTQLRHTSSIVSHQSLVLLVPITPASTSTNPNLKVQKLLAKAVGGVCPTDASAYVPNLTGIVANDKVCVRLVYDNATTGAVSNALITDSLPTGFTRVTNSTKNCLTPTGSSELCSDASGMGGAIGNNGWS
jgi:hypothetical protein